MPLLIEEDERRIYMIREKFQCLAEAQREKSEIIDFWLANVK